VKTETQPFRSYSANFEDVLLRRIFGNAFDGFFVDVGAAHPVMENDLYALYCQGWSGVNVEPNAAWFADIQRLRPRDRNLNIALSDREEERIYYEVVDTGLSTLDAGEAARCREQGWQVIEHRLQTRTLASILDEQPPARFDVLKVDVEGFEERVLLGNDWERFRPSLILVEATFPERRTRRETGIAALLDSKRYRHVHFDGLNDFYAEHDFHEADEALDLPPGVFDHFVSYRVAALEEYNQSLLLTGETAARASRSEIEHLGAALETTKQHAANLEAMLADSSRQLAHAAAERSEFVTALDNQTRLAVEQAGIASEQTRLATEQAGAAEAARSGQQEARLVGARLSDDAARLKASLERSTLQNRQYSADLEASHRDREELLLLRTHIHHLQSRTTELTHDLDRHQVAAQDERTALAARLDDTEIWLDAVRNSTSWRLTRPVRVLTRSIARSLDRKRRPTA